MKGFAKMWTFIYHSKTLRLQLFLKMLPNLATKSMRTCRLLSLSSSFPCFSYSPPINLLFFLLLWPSFFVFTFCTLSDLLSWLLRDSSLSCILLFVCLQFFLIYNKAGAWLSLKVDSTWAIYQLCRLHFLNLVNYLVYKDILHAVSG